MSEVTRISPAEARQKIIAGSALLICAYEDDAKFAQYHLEGAMSFSDFKGQAENLPRDRELIFYCN